MRLTDAHTHALPDSPDTLALVDLRPGETPPGRSENLFFSCGIHPAEIGRYSPEELRETLENIPCAAVGECGLDALAETPPEIQEKIFRAQIGLAEELHRPMVIHCVRKYYEIIRVRQQTRARMPWLIHGFRGKPETGKALLKAGCLLSLSPTWLMHLTVFPDWLPDPAFLLETDESPLPLAEIFRHTAALRQEPEETLGARMEQNFRTFLGV
ncbi:MAG: TatD family hydrolase [Lentisphaeria bacterium]|nr:TatD family hydrolase [Lentisphaeria bacterium]